MASIKYHFPITIEQNFEPEWVNDPTQYLIEGHNQAKLLPDLPKALLVAYGAMLGQVTSMELSCDTALGRMVLRLQDSRYSTAQKGDKQSQIGG